MTIELYRRYRRALKITPFNGRVMPYNWSPLPNSITGELLLYSQMLDDFARELANSINDLTHRENRLRAWATALEGLTAQQVMVAHHEIVGDIATIGLGLPYVIRSRFLFAAAHLSHQANRARQPSWVDDLAKDGGINLETADRVGRGWRRYGRFTACIQTIGGQDYRDATGNFRNLYQHRFSPRVSQGITQMVSRRVNPDGSVCYGIGGRSPLTLNGICDALVPQRDRSYAAFERFQALVGEQTARMMKVLT